MTFSIDTLIDDVLIELILILPVNDVLNIRKVRANDVPFDAHLVLSSGRFVTDLQATLFPY